jgi:DNA-binding HxlR family transcriptional regulator
MRCRSCAPIPEEVRQLAGLLERRFSISVIWASAQGVTRFNEYVQALEPIAPATLTARLTELERAGILARLLIDDRPPRVEYRLTTRGKRLATAVARLGELA